MAVVSASAARQTLPAQLDRVEAGEEVAITRHGRVVAVLVHPDSERCAPRRDFKEFLASMPWVDDLMIERRVLDPERESFES